MLPDDEILMQEPKVIFQGHLKAPHLMTFMTLFLKFSRSSLFAMLAELSSISRKYLSVNSDTGLLYLTRRQAGFFSLFGQKVIRVFTCGLSWQSH